MKTLNFKGLTYFSSFFLHWFESWQLNKSKILKLTVINALITLFSEVVCRGLLSATFFSEAKYQFLVDAMGGGYMINKQSLINILMTIMASLLAGPVYFFKSKTQRFIFFIVFGAFNSLQAQYLANLVTSARTVFDATRFMFDLGYTAVVKFPIFELFRKPIVDENKILPLFRERGKQDIMTTFIKTSVLNAIF